MGFSLLSPYRNIAYCNVFYFFTLLALWYLVMGILYGVYALLGSKGKFSSGAVLAYLSLLFWLVVAYIQQRTLYSMCMNSVGIGAAPMATEKVSKPSVPSSADYLL
jgi:hypothetical protein